MRSSRLPGAVAWYVALAGVVFLALAPIAWMVSTSLKLEGEIVTAQARWIPLHPTLANYVEVFQRYAIVRWTLNSLWVAIASTLLVIVLASLGGYAFARMRFRGRDAIFLTIIAMLFVPFQVNVIPRFMLFSALNLTDGFTALILPLCANVTALFIMRQFFLSIPAELEDAARVDGAGDLRIWWSIVMPLARPAVLTVAVLTFLTSWNDFFWPLVVTRSDEIRTLPVGIAQFMSTRPGSGSYVPAYGPSMAGSVIASVIPLILFFVLQRYFIQGITRTGLKG